MRRLIASLPLTLLFAACSPAPTPASADAPAAVTSAGPPGHAGAATANAPTNLALGSPSWYAWVDQVLNISDDKRHGPDPGSNEWNQTVQKALGEEAPQTQPGSPEWQQSVDALLRTRVPAAH